MTDREVLLGDVPVRVVRAASGGEAEVCQVVGHEGTVVKLYNEQLSPQRRGKLRDMVVTGYPLAGRGSAVDHPPELAWPTALVRGSQGQVLGYAMRQFSVPAHVPLFTLFSRAQRRRFFPAADWRFLLGVAWNLASVTELIHRGNVLVGDFSCSNIVLDRDGFVTFLDCDSMAFTVPSSGVVHPAEMFTADYAPPERRAGSPVSVASDDFALAILLYRLLTAGNHPFGGWRTELGAEEESPIEDNIRAACSYVVHPDRVRTSRMALEPTWCLSPNLLHLARRAFGAGVTDPTARPTAKQWLRALNDEREEVLECAALPRHRYPGHLRRCPWCALAASGRDPFNPPEARQPAAEPEGPGRPSGSSQPTTRTAPGAGQVPPTVQQTPPPTGPTSAPAAPSGSPARGAGSDTSALVVLGAVVAALVVAVALLVWLVI